MTNDTSTNRRSFMKYLSTLGAGSQAVLRTGDARAETGEAGDAAPGAATTNKPNIVLLLSDQHRGDAMGCAGNLAARTPVLDKLAEQGVLFERCYTSGPVCCPARVSLMTGQRVNQHGVWSNNVEADRHGPSHVRNIRDAGYHTAVFGKTHLRVYQGDDGHTKDHSQGLVDWGYDDVHELKDNIPSSTHRCYYTDYLAEQKTLQPYEDYCRNYRRGERMGMRPWEHTPNLLSDDQHIDMYCCRKAAEWIQNYEDDKPFYLSVNLIGPHPPFDCPPEYRDAFKPEEMPLAIMDAPREPVSPLVKRSFERSKMQDMTECHSRVMTSHYYGMVAFDDYAIGLVVKALEERGLMDNTWIVYTTDHGEMLGDHRLYQKVVFYESAIHIPLIVRPPGGTRGWKVDGLADHTDISATLLEAAGAEQIESSPGRSLVPKVTAGRYAPDAQRGKEVVFSEVGRSGLRDRGGRNVYSMARTEQYKMSVDSVTRQPVELYDMVNDPKELRNLVNEPSLKSVREEFLEEHFSQLFASLDKAKLKFYQDGGIPSNLHREYPEY